MATNQLVDIKKKITEQFLQCCICMHEYVSTRRLPCRHNFCLNCLGKIADGKDEFSCPMCRANVDVPEGGMGQFPEDVPTQKMLDFVNGLPVAGEKSFFCEHHPNKILDLYCKTDNTLICGTCLVKQHKGHEAETIVDAAQEKKGSFQRMADAQDQKLHDIQKENTKYQKTKKNFKTETRHQVANVTRRAEMFKAAIDRRCNVLCNVIKNIHSRDLYELEQEQKMLKEQEDEAKTKKQRYVHVLEQPTDAEMLLCADSVEYLEPSDIEVLISTKDVTRITLPKIDDVETLVEKLFGQLEIEKKLTEKLITIRAFKTLHGGNDRIKRIVAIGNKIYVLSKGMVEVFSEQDEPALVINGFHDPKDMAVLPNGNILSIDEGLVKVFDVLEDEVYTVDFDPKLFGPCSIAVDERGLVYVGLNRNLKVFEISETYEMILLQGSSFELPPTTNIYINQSNDNIYSFSDKELVVFESNGNQLHQSCVSRFTGQYWSNMRDVAADIYGNTLVTTTGKKLFVLDKDMKSKHTFELPCEGGHIAVSSNGHLIHGTEDGQIVLYKYTE